MTGKIHISLEKEKEKILCIQRRTCLHQEKEKYSYIPWGKKGVKKGEGGENITSTENRDRTMATRSWAKSHDWGKRERKRD